MVSGLNLIMTLPYNVVIVGSNAETSAQFSTQLEPVKLNENMGMAIKSIFHGSINNITSKNNKIPFMVNVNNIEGGEADWRSETLELDEGNYSSPLAIIKGISFVFKETFGSDEGHARRRKPRLVKPLNPPSIDIDQRELDDYGNGFVSFTVKNMMLFINEDTPCSVFKESKLINSY